MHNNTTTETPLKKKKKTTTESFGLQTIGRHYAPVLIILSMPQAKQITSASVRPVFLV